MKKFQAWQPANLYKIVEKIMTSFGLGKDDYFKSIAKLEVIIFVILFILFINILLLLQTLDTSTNCASEHSTTKYWRSK